MALTITDAEEVKWCLEKHVKKSAEYPLIVLTFRSYI